MHEALQKGLDHLKGYNLGRLSAQIFVVGPQNFKETLTQDDKVRIKALVHNNDLSLVIHGSYLNHPWNKTKTYAAAIGSIKRELRIANEIGATGVVLHLGAGAMSDEVLSSVICDINDVMASMNIVGNTAPILWLENHTAKQSDSTFETPEKINSLFRHIDEIVKRSNITLRIGLCIDTAHLFACGVSLDSAGVAEQWLGELSLPTGTPIMFHLNDSSTTLGSGKDKHAPLARGNIWGKYHPEFGQLPISESGLMTILNYAGMHGLTVILERAVDDIEKDLILLRGLITP